MGRAVRLTGAEAGILTATMDPLPPDAPATVVYYPPAEPTVARMVQAMLRELETVAVELFPAWLPGARAISAPSGLGIAAVRVVAREAAAGSEHFGPFLAELAVCGLRRNAEGLTKFPPEIRAAGLARVLKTAYRRDSAAFLVAVPAGFPAERALRSASQWLAHHGHLGVWLVGLSDPGERMATIGVRVPGQTEDTDLPETVKTPAGPVIIYPPLAGAPHPRSPSEHRLEQALVKLDWAAGRAWNQTYQSHPLVNPVRLDLWWPDERCVVEIDGPDHLKIWKYTQDRRRDNMLQRDGLTVLRFTDGDVMGDIDAVLADIKQLITSRRTENV